MIRRALASLIRGYIWVTPNHPGRGLLGKFAHKLDRRPIVAEVSPGVRFSLRLDWGDDINYWTGRYESQGEVECFCSLLCPGMTVLDIGANQGLYTLAAARQVGTTGRVYAFEPVPTLVARLRANVELNGADWVTVVEQAASDRAGTATFYLNESFIGHSQGSLVRAATPGSMEVKTVRLDDFKLEHGIPRVGGVKIDVEGAELMVIRGMDGILRDDRPVVLLEHNEKALQKQGASGVELFAAVVAHGYQGHLIRDGKMIPVSGIQPPVVGGTEPLSNYIFVPAVALPDPS